MVTDRQSALVTELVPLLFVDDIQLCVQFYVNKLGFIVERKWEPDGKLGWCKLRRDKCAIMLQEACDEDGPAGARGQGLEFYFNCDDVDAMYDEIVGRGLVVDRPKVVFYGEKQLSLRDPAGYNLCFQSPAARI